jgi:hypothetical protein
METREQLTADVKPPRVLPPAGLHKAYCFGVVHLGTIDDTFKGEPKRTNKFRLYFELLEAKHTWNPDKGPESFIVEQDFTKSMARSANLRLLMNGYNGQDLTDDQAAKFNILDLAGCEMILNLIKKTSRNGNDRMEIISMTAPKATDAFPDKTQEDLIFTFTPPFKQAAFDRLPKFIQDKIKSSDEYRDNYLALPGQDGKPVTEPVAATVETAAQPARKKPPF